jgi:hypothetical protein
MAKFQPAEPAMLMVAVAAVGRKPVAVVVERTTAAVPAVSAVPVVY